MKHAFVILAVAALAVLSPAASNAQEALAREAWTAAVESESPEPLRDFALRSLEALNETLEGHAVLAETRPAKEILAGERGERSALVFASPLAFSVLERNFGYYAVATLARKADGKETSEMSAVLLSRPAGEDEKSFAGMKGELVAVPDSDAPDALLFLEEELRIRGLPGSFFRIESRAESPRELLRLAREGKVPGVLLTTSLAESLPSELLSGLRAVEPKTGDELNSPHSAPAYPGWVLAASLDLPKTEAEMLGASLRALPREGGYGWILSSDYRTVRDAAEATGNRFYAGFRSRTWREFARENAPWIAAGGLFLVSLVLLLLGFWYMLRKRTRELVSSERNKRDAENRYEQLERLSTVAQMSNIVAHELRQPLAAISNYATGIRRRQKNGSLEESTLLFALGKIISENDRANEIVEHVRNYAKKRERKFSVVPVPALLRKIAAGVEGSEGFISIEAEEVVTVEADALELELILRNLMKNAVEAVGMDPRRAVRVKASRGDGLVTIRVEDNGPVKTEEDLAPLRNPLLSTKRGGLGLGVSIVRRLVESYDGKLAFEAMSPHGLAATVVLPEKRIEV